MLTEEHTKERLSRAYIQAIGARAGVIVSLKERCQDYGIDGSFHEVALCDGRRRESGTTLDFQLKATSRQIVQGEYVSFPLEADVVNFLALRGRQPHTTPVILIVLSLPARAEEWLELSEEALVLKRCCYWVAISSLTPNVYSANIKIPRTQILTPEAIHNLLKKVSEGQPA